MPLPLLRRALLLAVAALGPAATGVASQALGAPQFGDPLVPRGRLRLRMDPVYSIWDHRFGERTVGGTTIRERESLGSDLTDSLGTSLFPGVEELEARLGSLTGNASYSSNLGAVRGIVGKQITRVDFGADIGVFDWLTVGVTVPWLRTETTVEVAFRPDAASADLGISPAVSDTDELLFFLQEVQDAATDAALGADAACAGAPSSPSCQAAQGLAARAEAMYAGLQSAYYASPFFPLEGSAVAGSLSAAIQTLGQDLSAAGLSGISSPALFSTVPVTEEEFAELPSGIAYGIGGAPLTHLRSLWDYGDVELSAAARILDSSPEAAWTYGLVGGLRVRLPTGKLDDPDVFLDVGWGDHQTDWEGRLRGVIRGPQIAAALGGRYGWQAPSTIVRRIAPPEVVLPPLSTRRTVRWYPGAYLGLDVTPRWRLADALSLLGEYRLFRKGADRYELVGTPAAGDPDPAVLEAESPVTLHQAGIGLSYSTLPAWRAGRAPTPMEFELRVVRAMAGGGGQAPAWTRMEVAIHVFRRLWGTP